MEKTPTESSPVVIQSVQSDGVFNAGIILTETNYDVWSQIMEMHLAEREKLSYIRSNTKPFEESSKEYEKWYSENQKVKRWLLISMSLEIMKRYLRIPTAYEIWDALSKAFYDGSDELQVFTLNQKAFSTKQNGQPLSKFYGELVEIFREFDHRDKVVMKDPEDVVIYRRSAERLRVHIFLAGLDEEFDQVRGEILRKDIIPDLEECYSLIRREDIRQSKLNKKVDSETSAMIARQQPQRKFIDKSSLHCTHCRKKGHTKEQCFEIIGYPDWWDTRKKNTKHGSKTAVSTSTTDLRKESSVQIATSVSPVPFMVVHSDVWGPSKVSTIGGARWFVTFIDDCSRMTWIFLMKSKDEVNSLFQRFHKMVTTQFQTQIRVLHTDNGGEYMSTAIQQFLKSQGSVHQTTCVGTPQQNGVAERKNRHLLEVVRASLIQAHMPLSYWGEALASAAYLINRTPSSSLGFQTPFQVLNDAIMSPNVPNLPPHVFGCVAFVHLPQQDKLSPRALRCVFVGYALHQKGYRCYHPPSRKIYITMDVVFHEDIMYYLSESEFQGEYNEEEIHTLTYLPPEESQSSIEIVNLQDTGKANGDDSQAEICEDTFGEHNNSDTTAIENESHEEIPNQSSAEDVPTISPIRRILPQRQNRGIPKPTYEPDFSSRVKYPMSHFVSNHRLSESNQSFVNQLSVVSIPNSVQEALKDPKWKVVMNDEMRSLQKNQTWELVDLPPGKKPVGCRWIYTIKYKADGSIKRYKARLVAKGYTQTYGIDYTDTFAPVAKINTIRILLSLAVNLDWPVQQFDVKNAFLHGDLSEEIYMDLPPRCSGPERLNQKAMVRFGYNQSNSDHTLFIKKRQGKITALIVYVDDMVVTDNDEEETEALQKYLSREFEMKDLGALKYFLGIEVSRSKGGIFPSQRKYALDLLHETGMTACQPIDTPIEEGLKFCITSDQVPVDKGRYQRLIGRLMYLSHTRPDLAYALSVVSQFMHNPGEQHMKAVMRILSNIEVYTDADWAGSVSDRRSTSGYFTFVGGNLVTWRSKKQHVVARSSAEAEYRGMALGICEGLWISFILNDLGYPSQQPIQLYCDNKAARDIAHNPVQHDRTKHVEGVNKGLVAKRLLSTMQEREMLPDFVMCVGDDRSDEDMFEVIINSMVGPSIAPGAEVFACTDGRKPSKAKYYLDDTVEVVRLMQSLACVADQMVPV
ncbi:retrovirus-related pol polyprotein from transposon RE1 [Citrus sinensis]|uniref:Retrovirus-related pol polyprotein from transposon RE1 n=2 Tax=Citrus sinensis TaxID=2711 RepID=A0ACB8LN83_CITSI|nr:retrovirus-related pol polyprotein from transposon RE1 [Citrus sinensis]